MPAARNDPGSPTSASIAFDQSRNCAWSSTGTPSSSQMTVTGSGNANARIRSTTGSSARDASIASSSEAVTASTRGRSPATRRAVNAFDTSLRSRVCPGGSALSMCTAR